MTALGIAELNLRVGSAKLHTKVYYVPNLYTSLTTGLNNSILKNWEKSLSWSGYPLSRNGANVV
jgi:hypothetical protein